MTASEILARLEHVRPHRRGWSARCPAHADHTPSLDVAAGADGRTLVLCRAGCRPREIVAALGLSLADLFAEARPRAQGKTLHVGAFSLLEQARRDVLREALREPWNAPGMVDLYGIADWIRWRRRDADILRQSAGATDDDPAWTRRAMAAELDTLAENFEAALIEALA